MRTRPDASAPEYGFLEILDAERHPVRAGEEGYFVWTGFLNDAMPLIRYRIGDRGRWLHDETCAVRPRLPRWCRPSRAKATSSAAPDGRLFSPRALNQLLKQAAHAAFLPIRTRRPDRVAVRAGARDQAQARRRTHAYPRRPAAACSVRTMQAVTAEIGRDTHCSRRRKNPADRQSGETVTAQ